MAVRRKPPSDPPASRNRGREPSVPPVVEEAMREGTFTAEKFVEAFPVLVDAAGGTNGIRKAVLQLAARGLLVHQHRAEGEGAACLGARNPGDVVGPFDIPASWTWATGGEVFEFVTSGSRGWAQFYAESGPLFLRIGNLDYRTTNLDLSSIQRVSPPKNAEGTRTRVRSGDLLISITGDTGMVGFVPPGFEEAYINQHIALARPMQGVFPEFIGRVLTAPFSLGHLQSAQRGIKNSLGLDDIRALRIPLPPLAEQKRIVAKVDQLMALIDELEAKQTKKREVGAKFTKASLEALTTAEGPEEFDRAWKRVVENWETVLDRPEKVGEIRRAVLRIAIRGRLVNQRSTDGSVEPLLTAIERRRGELLRERKASQMDDCGPVEADESPFPIPESWAWVRFGKATICRDGQRVPVSKDERAGRHGNYPYYGASGIIDDIDDFIFDEPLLLVGEDGANLVNRSKPIAFIAEGKYWVNNHAHVLDGGGVDSLRYVALFINATDLVPYVTGTAQPKMNQAKMNSIPVAFPPLAEQKRIVTKVDQLMALCDMLDSALLRSVDRAQKLVQAVVEGVVG